MESESFDRSESEAGSAACVVGIDPGFSGGLAAVTLGGEAVLARPMPVLKGKRSKTEVDVARLVALLCELEHRRGVSLVVVERVGAMPRQGVASTFAFGRGFGEVLGAVKALGLALELPLPRAWKGGVLAGSDGGQAAAIGYVRRRFPGVDLLATPRSRTPSDGIADAVCLAEFGRRLVVGRAAAV